MILTNQQRAALITEITAAISGNARTSLLFSGELEKGRTELFVMCRREYMEQRSVYNGHRPFYIQDDRGTFGFMRLRDDDGRVLGYDDGDAKDDPADQRYNPSPADREKITAAIKGGTPLYYYVSEEYATMTGVTLPAYTRRAVNEYERKRHRRFDMMDANPNNSAVYMALHESYFTQYSDEYDLPTLPAGTKARKDYYARLIQKAANGEITLTHVQRFPNGKGTRPKSWGDGIGIILSIGYAIGYNCYVGLNGRGTIAHDENEIDTEKYDASLFSGAIR